MIIHDEDSNGSRFNPLLKKDWLALIRQLENNPAFQGIIDNLEQAPESLSPLCYLIDTLDDLYPLQALLNEHDETVFYGESFILWADAWSETTRYKKGDATQGIPDRPQSALSLLLTQPHGADFLHWLITHPNASYSLDYIPPTTWEARCLLPDTPHECNLFSLLFTSLEDNIVDCSHRSIAPFLIKASTHEMAFFETLSPKVWQDTLSASGESLIYLLCQADAGVYFLNKVLTNYPRFFLEKTFPSLWNTPSHYNRHFQIDHTTPIFLLMDRIHIPAYLDVLTNLLTYSASAFELITVDAWYSDTRQIAEHGLTRSATSTLLSKLCTTKNGLRFLMHLLDGAPQFFTSIPPEMWETEVPASLPYESTHEAPIRRLMASTEGLDFLSALYGELFSILNTHDLDTATERRVTSTMECLRYYGINTPEDRESAMQKPSNTVLQFSAACFERYNASLSDPSIIETSLNAIRTRLSALYDESPATIELVSQDTIALPLTWSDFQALGLTPENKKMAFIAYYQHWIHSAWRFLLTTNPWMEVSAPFSHSTVDGQSAYFDRHAKTIALIYLMLSDKTMQPISPDITPDAVFLFLFKQFDECNRAHSESMDAPDSPSCSDGILHRLYQVLPFYIKSHVLDAVHFEEALVDFVRTHLMESIKTANRTEIEKCLSKVFLLAINTPEVYSPLKKLDITSTQVDAFITHLKTIYEPSSVDKMAIPALMDARSPIHSHITQFWCRCHLGNMGLHLTSTDENESPSAEWRFFSSKKHPREQAETPIHASQKEPRTNTG